VSILFKPKCEACSHALGDADLKAGVCTGCGIMPISPANRDALLKMAGLEGADTPDFEPVKSAPPALPLDAPECKTCGIPFFGDDIIMYNRGECPSCDSDPREEEVPSGPSYSNPSSLPPVPAPPVVTETPTESPSDTDIFSSKPETKSDSCWAKFVFLIGPLRGQNLTVPIGMPFGRKQFAEQVGKDFPGYDRISGKHFEITLNHDKIWIQDLDSTNGTICNGKKLSSDEPVEINGGSVITINKGSQLIPMMMVGGSDIPGPFDIEAPLSTPICRIIEQDTGIFYPLGMELQECIGRDPHNEKSMHPILQFLRLEKLHGGLSSEEVNKQISTISRRHFSIVNKGENFEIINHSSGGTIVTVDPDDILLNKVHKLNDETPLILPSDADISIQAGKITLKIDDSI